jgi:hypothetical protein
MQLAAEGKISTRSRALSQFGIYYHRRGVGASNAQASPGPYDKKREGMASAVPISHQR